MSKSAVMVFSKNSVEGGWKWGKHKLPKVSNYSYLGIDFASNGAWDVHLKKVLDNGRKKVNQLHSVISNRDINLSARRLLLLSVIRPSIEYGGEVWEGNKSQVDALESIILGGAKRILGCSTYCTVSISYHNSNSALLKKTALLHTLMLEGFIH